MSSTFVNEIDEDGVDLQFVIPKGRQKRIRRLAEEVV